MIEWRWNLPPLTIRDKTAHNLADVLDFRAYNTNAPAITAPDDYTVVVHMKERFSPIIAFFMGLQGGGPILPAHVLARYPDMNRVPFNSRPVGSGPFQVVDWVHGDHITLMANPKYWRGTPKLHQIIYKWIGSNTTIMTQLRTGEVDAWFRADPGLYPQLATMPGRTTTERIPSLAISSASCSCAGRQSTILAGLVGRDSSTCAPPVSPITQMPLV